MSMRGSAAASAATPSHLDAEAAVPLMKQPRAGDTPLNMLFKDLQAARAGGPDNDHEVTAALILAAQAGDEAARNVVVVDNVPLVIKIARSFTDRGLEMADVIQEGSLGLFDAIRLYDPDRAKFVTYASYWIKERIRRALKEYAYVYLPFYLYNALSQWKAAQARLRLGGGREPTRAETIAHLGWNQKKADCVLHAEIVQALVRSETPRDDWGRDIAGTGPLAGLVAPGRKPEESVEEAEDVAVALRALRELDQRSAQILMMRLGLPPYPAPATLKECGQHLGLTRERVRQLEKRALGAICAKLGVESVAGNLDAVAPPARKKYQRQPHALARGPQRRVGVYHVG